MHRIYTAKEASKIDSYSIAEVGIPSLVLMERAALAVTNVLLELIKEDNYKEVKVLAISGMGNNGADAVAVARQLQEEKIKADVLLAANADKLSEELDKQLEIAKKLSIEILSEADLNSYDYIIDGLFGNGLCRNIEGHYKELIEDINASEAKVVSIDLPSGINATTGACMGIAVQADFTVTFGKEKVGLILYPGASYASKIKVVNIGFAPTERVSLEDNIYALDDEDFTLIPKRDADSNKGSFGKVLIVAGSKEMGGAPILSAMSALHTGAGLVRVFTHEVNRDVLLSSLPEVIPITYTDDDLRLKTLEEEIKKADSLIVGPGLSTSEEAKKILDTCLSIKNGKIILDADALNLIACQDTINILKELVSRNNDVIITPHLKEMSRLSKINVEDIKKDLINIGKDFSKSTGINLVLKDSRTIITDGDKTFVNTAGNSGMATGGVGDTLTGIIAGLIAMGLESKLAARLAVYVHAKAGDKAREESNAYYMTATDIVKALASVLE